MEDLVGPVASAPLPLERKLLLLREKAIEGGRLDRLVRWAREHPEIAAGAEWCQRVWWGAAAGEVVRDHLYDPARRAGALELLAAADTAALEAARRAGGVIIAAAHLGPPKFLMNCLLERNLPLLIWTNRRDLPAWLAARGGGDFLDPLERDQRAALLVRSALHLRRGGVLLAAADRPSGERTVVLERLGMTWRFSLGLPALARRLAVPVVVALAAWRGERIELGCRLLEPPDERLGEDAWNRAWLERYWACLEPTVRREPENLRFLRWAVDRVVPPPRAPDS